ncbi:unnamed protein product, partial [Strongylus vulgaris]
MRRSCSFFSNQSKVSTISFPASHLSPREPIDEAVERFNNTSLSDRASQFSYRSTGSNQGMYQSYPQIVPYPVSEEVIYPSYHQQMYMQPTPMLAPASVEIYPPQPTIVMPLQQNPQVQQQVPLMQCQPQE